MPLTTTLLDLRDAVRERSDTVGSRRVTDAKVNRAINSAIRRFYAKVVPLAEDHFTARAVLTTDAAGSYAELPDDFLVLRDVAWDPGGIPAVEPLLLTEGGDPLATEGGDSIALEEDGVEASSEPDACLEPMGRFQLQDRWRYPRRGWNKGCGVAYRLVGPPGAPKRMEFVPIAGAARVVVVRYVPTPPVLATDTDTFDGMTGAEEWVIWDAAIQILIAEESDARQATAERELVWAEQILPVLATYDQARPDRVIDVEGCAEECW